MSDTSQFAPQPKRPMPKILDKYRTNGRLVLKTGDSLQLLQELPDKSVNLVVTSPPYNVDKAYEKRQNFDVYLAGIKSMIKELTRVVDDDGAVCWQIGNYVKEGELFPLDYYHYGLFHDEGFKLRNRIVWHFGHGLHSTRRLAGRYEMLLWFTKGDKYTFNVDEIRVPAKYPGKRYYKGDKKGQPSGNRLGKNPSDVWEVIIKEFEAALWDIPNVKANHREKTEHPCQFPIEVAERCVLAMSNKNDVILDPYAGVGSSLLAGLMHERRVIGFEQHHPYIETARTRIHQLFDGCLPYRPMGTPVHTPKGTEKVARMPDEWLSLGSTSNLPMEPLDSSIVTFSQMDFAPTYTEVAPLSNGNGHSYEQPHSNGHAE